MGDNTAAEAAREKDLTRTKGFNNGKTLGELEREAEEEELLTPEQSQLEDHKHETGLDAALAAGAAARRNPDLSKNQKDMGGGGRRRRRRKGKKSRRKSKKSRRKPKKSRKKRRKSAKKSRRR